MSSYEQRSYPGAAAETTLLSDITSGSTSFNVASGTGAGYPDGSAGPFFVIIDWDNSKAEKIRCSARSGDSFTVAPSGGGRGQDGTSATGHSATAKIRSVWTATDAQESNRAVSQTVGQVAAKGDLLLGSGVNALTKLAVGPDGQVLVADSTQTGGAHWRALTESDIANLVTDLNARVVKSLLSGKGSLVGASAAATPADIPVGADGTILTADSTQANGVKWASAAAVSGTLLASTSNSLVNATNNTATFTDVDATNAAVTFTAPASGKVIIRVNAFGNNGGNGGQLVWGLREATTNLAGTSVSMTGTSGAITVRGAFAVEITGLTGGTAHTYKLAQRQAGTAGLNAQTGNSEPFLMEVWAA